MPNSDKEEMDDGLNHTNQDESDSEVLAEIVMETTNNTNQSMFDEIKSGRLSRQQFESFLETISPNQTASPNQTRSPNKTVITTQHKAAVRLSNRNRTGVKRNSYDNDLKISVCDYFHANGGSYQSIADSPTFKHHNLHKTTVRDMIKGEAKWREHKRKNRDGGAKRRVHNGKSIKYPMLEEPLKTEYDRRKKLSLDVSRDWAMKRASDMYIEWQLNGVIRELPHKANQGDWTPHEITKENKLVADLDTKMKTAIHNKTVKIFPRSMSWFYAFLSRNDKTMARSYCKKDMSDDEWNTVKFDTFIPDEMAFVASLESDELCEENGTLKRVNSWNDDEVPIDLQRSRKQITDNEKLYKDHIMVKALSMTRDINKRFCTVAPFLNGDAFRLLPDEYAICLVIMPGKISHKEMGFYQKRCPNLCMHSNEKCWQSQYVWEQWNKAKLKVVNRSRNYLRQKRTTPHLNFIDQQPNHKSAESLNKTNGIAAKLEKEALYTRFYPARSSLHAQATDRHVGRTLQQKIQSDIFELCEKQNQKRMKNIPFEKIRLGEMRKHVGVFIQQRFMEIIIKHKELQLRAFDGYGMNLYTPRVWGGYDNMRLKQYVYNNCHIEGKAGVLRDYGQNYFDGKQLSGNKRSNASEQCEEKEGVIENNPTECDADLQIIGRKRNRNHNNRNKSPAKKRKLNSSWAAIFAK